MATIIQIKRSSGTAAPSTLKLGELAYTYGTGTQGNNGDRLFIGEGGVDGNGDANNITVIGGQYFVDQLDHANGTLTASSALLVDSNKAIDEIFVGNAAAAGGQIKFNEGTNNGSNYVGLKAPASVTTSIELTLPSTYSDGQFLTVDSSGVLSFTAVPSGSFSIAGDSGTDTFTTGQTLTFTGDTAITTTISDNEVSIDLDDTAVTAGSYGSSTEIPTFTVDQQGRLTAAGTESISTTLDIAADSGTDDGVTLGTDTLTFTGGTGIDTSVSGDAVTFAIDNTVTTNSGTQTLTNKTLTAPKIADAGFIADANGNEQIIFNTTASAVNQFEVSNADTGNGVTFASSGSDTNIDIILDPKGSGSVDVNSSKITNVSDPSSDQDAATKAYVDSVANGLDVKDSVRLATTAALATSTYNNSAGTITADANGALSIDGVTPSASDRVLVKDQASSVQNGIYTVTTVGDGSTAFVLTRAPDADTASELTGGTFFFVEEGTANADNGYVATHNGIPTFGTTNITFSQFSGAGQISAGDALTKTGNQLDVAVDDSTIEVSSDALQVKDSGITATQLASNAVTTIKITDLNVTAAKLAGTLDLSGKTITLPSTFTTNSGTQTLTNKTINGPDNTLTNIANSSLANSAISFTDESSTAGSVSLGGTLEFLAGEGIDTTASGSTITIAAELATTSNKGVASFSSDNFAVSTGEVTVTAIDGGTF